MSKHTPGPWGYVIASDAVEAIGDTRQMICVAYPTDANEWTDDKGVRHPSAVEESWPANARLISAAPELLQILKEVAVDYRECGMEEREIMSHVRAAIAKAEGK